RSLTGKLAALILNKKLGRKYQVKILGDLRKPKFKPCLKDISGFTRKYFPQNIYHLPDIARILGLTKKQVINQHLRLADGKIFGRIKTGFKLRSRVLHNLTEWQRVEKSVRLLKSGKWRSFGRLMYQSHASLRDNYEVSCPELEKLVSLAKKFGVVGARLTGAGFGGCTVNLVRKEKEQSFIDFIDKKYYRDHLKKRSGKKHIFICRSTSGALGKVTSGMLQ
ncbi:MAG: hypothetical protein KAI63_08630, partial [Planctomycetes bacterium]|nr:hypothetical protein [Planctomycetota bacterium]